MNPEAFDCENVDTGSRTEAIANTRLLGSLEEQGISGTHPMIGNLLGTQTVEIEKQQLDTFEDVYKLEQEYQALQYIRLWYAQPDLEPLERALAPLYSPMHSVESIGNQFAKKVVPCFMAESVDEGLSCFRNITPNTIDEEMALLVNDKQFQDLHSSLKEHLSTLDDEIKISVSNDLAEINKADRYQFSGNSERNLENMLVRGLNIKIDPSNIEKIREAWGVAGEGILPVTEYLKNDKILDVSGFMGSKISLAVHDCMDHVWTFNMLNKSGLLEKYFQLFDSIGNPETTDLFKREGEIVASIAFGVRYFQTMPAGFGPLFRASRIEEHLDNLFINNKLEHHHLDAYRIIKTLRKGSMEWQSLGFAFSNYITELDEQRRKFGTIKQRDLRTRKITGELDPLSPEYICFFIDTHHQIHSSENKHRNDLFRFHILLEEYLSSIANGSVPRNVPLVIRINQLRDLDFTKTTLPANRIQWMANNPGFTATRDAIV